MALGRLAELFPLFRLRLENRMVVLPILLVLGLSLLISGCVQSDLTLHFDHQTRGLMTQSIRLHQGGSPLTNPTLEPWLTTLRKRVGELGGSFTQTPDQINLAVPFTTAADLEQRFIQTWAAIAAMDTLPISAIQPLPVNLQIQQNHWLLASRNHLIWDFDLQSLRDLGGLHRGAKDQGWASFSLRLATPWGSRVLASSPELAAISQTREVRWQLQVGELNHLDVIFWLPDLVGIGGLVIAMVVVLGYFLRYRLLAVSPAQRALDNSDKA